MSESILNALMQLFAIVANVDGENDTSRSFVRIFLEEELDAIQTEKYLQVYDEFIQHHHFRKRTKDGAIKRTSRNSVKMLRIAAEINRSLTKPQKQIALLRLIEFVYSRNISTAENREFIEVISDAFNIEQEAFEAIMQFVCFGEVAAESDSLLIASKKPYSSEIKHLERAGIQGQLVFLYLANSGLLAFKSLDNQGLLIAGAPIRDQRIYLMQKGSAIRGNNLEAIYYSNILIRFTQENIAVPINLSVEELTFKFPNGNVAIQPMNFDSKSGELVGIMGGSGTGKSTLLSILNGTNKPTSGHVIINGFDLYEEHQKLNGLIGFVPQDDLLLEDLTVWQNLFYSAQLSFGSLTKESIEKKVAKTLQELGLFEVSQLKVGSPLDKSISGGQRKRLNIALELIREPAVLFVDEPTSGLSSRDSEKIMDLLKGLTLKGCIVYAVIHQPSSEIFRQFDQLLVLDRGGYLVYQGNPLDGINYFREASDQVIASDSQFVVNAEQIFDILEAPIVDEFGEYTNERKVKPENWYERFNAQKSGRVSTKTEKQIPKQDFEIPGYLKQFRVFVTRDLRAKLANTQYLAINLLEMPMLAAIIAGFLRYNGGQGYEYRDNMNILAYIFISIIVALFIGLSVSAEEIIKDRSIRKRESFLNLSWGGYLNSKIAILFTLSSIQIALYVIIGNTILEIKGMYFSYWIVLFTAAAIANVTGLIISASFKRVVTIYILIPFIIIPQIMFSGLLVKYERLNPWFSDEKEVPLIGDAMASRWLFEALVVNQSINNEFDKHFFEINVKLADANFRKNFWLPEMETTLLYLKNQVKLERTPKTIEKGLLLKNELDRLPAKVRKYLLVETELLQKQTYTLSDLQKIDEFLAILKDYYGRNLSSAVNKKDEVFSSVQKSLEKGQSYNEFKKMYQNEQLNDYLNSKSSLTKIIVANNEILNKENQTFQIPKTGSPHYFAPMKLMGGTYYKTYYYNVVMMWLAVFALVLALYFNILPRLLNWKN